MTRVWLASYPRSGNTWFRMLIAGLSATDERPLDINALPEPSRNISRRDFVDTATMIETELLTHAEADSVRSGVYTTAPEAFDEGPTAGPRFFKVHDAYTHMPGGEPVLGRLAGAAILLVRDPRDVAVSLAAHLDKSLDWTLEFMGKEDASLGGMDDDRIPAFRQRLLTWSGHAASWLDQRAVPVHLVKYESLLEDPVSVFLGAMRFAGRDVTREQVERAVEQASFTRLQTQENARGFAEAPRHGRPFFGQGRAGRWRDALTADQAAWLENDHAAMMARLAYGPAGPPLEMGPIL